MAGAELRTAIKERNVVEFRYHGRPRVAHPHAIFIASTGTHCLDAGESKTVEVRIPKYAKKYAKKHRLKVKATALARNAAGDDTIASKYVTLEFPKKKK